MSLKQRNKRWFWLEQRKAWTSPGGRLLETSKATNSPTSQSKILTKTMILFFRKYDFRNLQIWLQYWIPGLNYKKSFVLLLKPKGKEIMFFSLANLLMAFCHPFSQIWRRMTVILYTYQDPVVISCRFLMTPSPSPFSQQKKKRSTLEKHSGAVVRWFSFSPNKNHLRLPRLIWQKNIKKTIPFYRASIIQVAYLFPGKKNIALDLAKKTRCCGSSPWKWLFLICAWLWRIWKP